MKWIPPIPYGALYSKPARDLGHALALLGWCYDNVTTDGWLDMNLQEIAGELDTPYRTLKLWWRALRESPFIAAAQDRGRRGLRIRMADDWIDWRILEARIIKNGAENSPSTEKNRPEMGQVSAPEIQNGTEMGRKWDGNGAENSPSTFAYKGTHDFQESESHETTSSPTPRVKRTPDRAMVMMLISKGVQSEAVANEIAAMGLDYDTVEQSVDNMLANKASVAAIVRFLRSTPPDPGQPYPRARAPTHTVTVDVPPPQERPSKPVLSAAERRALLEQHRNGS